MARPFTPLAERFWPKVDQNGPWRPAPLGRCWLWTGAKDPSGYGRVCRGGSGSAALAHRVPYELVRGPIPDGLPLDHLCRNTSCVKPDHLEAVPMKVNSLRGNHPRYAVYKTNICLRGHDRSIVGVRVYPNGRRACKECIRESGRAWARKQKEKRHG